MEKLIQADEKVYDDNVRLTALRKLRDKLTATLAAEIVRLRRLIPSLYKDPDLQTLGLFSPRVRLPQGERDAEDLPVPDQPSRSDTFRGDTFRSDTFRTGSGWRARGRESLVHAGGAWLSMR